MKRILLAIVLAVVMVVSLAGFAIAAKPGNTEDGFGGNGAPSGSHYNLNIIGAPGDKNPDMNNNNGHRIFVPLEGRIRIMLSEGPFAVLDANGTDGQAVFQLPAPDPENDGITTYSVFVRGLGKKGKSASIEPGFIDEYGNEWYSTATVTVESKNDRSKGNNKFTNVSRELLYVYVDMDGDGSDERYPLFCEELWEFFWDYDNSGLKLCQMRFYEIPTDVN
jgi:hypothetical protein